MKKCIVLVFFVIGVASVGYAREIPVEVKRFLEDHVKDSTSDSGPLSAKAWGFLDNAVQLKDVRVERILKGYKFKHVFLDEYPDTVHFSEIIEPSGDWRALITGNGKPAYELCITLDKLTGKVRYAGKIKLPPDGGAMWRSLLKVYPESTGINPIYISYNTQFLLYFQEIGSKKLCYSNRGISNYEILAEWLPCPQSATDTLSDSKRFIEYLRMRGINEVGMSRERIEERRRQEGKDGQPRKRGDY
jgi:hypothetical protein